MSPLVANIDAEHVAHLYGSGLMDSTIAIGEFRTALAEDIQHYKGVLSAIEIIYSGIDGKPTGHRRFRLFPPLITVDGKEQKYGQEYGTDCELFLSRLIEWLGIVADLTIDIDVVEGEKKAAAMCQAGRVCIGIAGVWNFRQRLDNGERIVIPTLTLFNWKGRKVRLIPDSDVWRKDKFSALCGFYALGMILADLGAHVVLVKLPEFGQGKVGPDDYLLKVKGDEGALQYLDEIPLDDPSLKDYAKWWQEWHERELTRRALQQHAGDDLVLTELVGLWTVRSDHYCVRFVFERLTEQRGTYYAELTVTIGATDLLDAVSINLKSDASQSGLVKSLKLYATSIPWKILLQRSCALVLRRYRRGTPPIHINRDSTVEPLTFAVNPLVVKKKSTILFTDGGKGKSTYALFLAMLVSIGLSLAGFSALPGRPLFLDWEDDHDVHTRRLKAIQAGHPELEAADVLYLRCTEPLTKLTYELARMIQHESITFVVVDSLLAAMGGEASAEAVGKFFAALRVLQVETLLIGHTPKTLGEGQEHPTVYGSVFNQNFARSVWELKTEQEIGDDSAVLGLFHRKSNLTRKHHPIGLKVTHAKDGTFISYESFDLNKTTELEAALPLPSRIRNLLDSDGVPRTAEQIAKELGVEGKLPSVRTTLSRHKGKKWSKLGEDKWTTISSGK